MKQTMLTLFTPLLALLLCGTACSSDDSNAGTPNPTPNPPAPQPTSYDIYTAGYKRVDSKAAATVWKNGQELYALTDGSSNAWAHALCVDNGTLYTAGYYTKPDFEEQGVVWKNGTPLYTLSDGTSSGSMPYAVAAWGDDLFTAGTLFGSSRHAAVWKGSDLLYTLGRGEAYAMYVVPHYESDETTGAEESGDTSGNN